MAQESELEKEMRDYYREQGQTHGIEHLDRTLKIGDYIAEKEGGDQEIVRWGCMLHQLHDPEKAEKLLKEHGFGAEKIERILHCVRCSDIDKVDKAETIEAKTVYDADKLQVVGPFGLIREIACDTGERGKRFREALQDSRRIEEKCYSTLQTETGRKIGEIHHEMMEELWEKFDAMDEAWFDHE